MNLLIRIGCRTARDTCCVVITRKGREHFAVGIYLPVKPPMGWYIQTAKWTLPGPLTHESTDFDFGDAGGPSGARERFGK